MSKKKQPKQPISSVGINQFVIQNKLQHNYSPQQIGIRWYIWGEDDLLPQRAEDYINANGTARLALQKQSQYVVGKGFINEETRLQSCRFYAGPGMKGYKSMQNLFAEVAAEAVFYSGAFCLGIRRDCFGGIQEIESLTFGKFRRYGNGETEPICWGYNKFRNRLNYVIGSDILLPEYEGAITAERQQEIYDLQIKRYGKYYGEVYAYIPAQVGIEWYPIPTWYSSSELIEGNTAANKSLNNKARQLFAPSMVMSIPRLNDTKAQNGISQRDQFYTEMKQKLNGENPANAFVLEFDTKDNMPEVTVLDTGNLPEQLTKITYESAKQVCLLIGVDPCLLGFADAGQLGNNQQLAVAEGMLTDRCKSIREPILEAFAEIMNVAGVPFDPTVGDIRQYSAAPDAVITALYNGQQLAEMYNLPPVSPEMATKYINIQPSTVPTDKLPAFPKLK